MVIKADDLEFRQCIYFHLKKIFISDIIILIYEMETLDTSQSSSNSRLDMILYMRIILPLIFKKSTNF